MSKQAPTGKQASIGEQAPMGERAPMIEPAPKIPPARWKLYEVVTRTRLPASPQEAWACQARPGALVRLTPPWTSPKALYQPARFARWEYSHRLDPDGPDGCWFEERVRFSLPLPAVSGPLFGRAVARRLGRIYRYRHDTLRADLAVHRGGRPLRVLVSGASGLIGSQLVAFLSTGGHEVVRLLRAGSAHETPVAGARASIPWDPATGQVDGELLEGFDAVVHLAGAGIGARRWSDASKAVLRDSRLQPTAALARALTRLRRPPAVFACASATGFYGNRGEALLGERADAGVGFLPDLCLAWEAATAPAQAHGIRTVNLRFGIVLSPRGGALAKLLPPFRLGAGGPVGNGRQWWSWISIDDAVLAIHHALRTDSLSGPCNVVAPQPVPNLHFAQTLGAVLRRPSLLPLPAPAARVLVGEMADALLLASTRVMPLALLNSGFEFRHARLGPALEHLLGRLPP